MGRKIFLGARLRRLRSERGWTQVAMARALGLSPSYLNQLEKNQRPLTVPVLLRISRVLGVDVQQLSDDEQARLVAATQLALAEAPEPVSLPEVRELVERLPTVARAIVALGRQKQVQHQQLEALTLRLGDDRVSETGIAPFEKVRDFFYAHRNHFDALDRAAEHWAALAASTSDRVPWLVQQLQQLGVHVVLHTEDAQHKRRFDAASRTLWLSATLAPAQQAFQLATQWALLAFGNLIDEAIDDAALRADPAALRLARIGLANYFAGAWLLPYRAFLHEAHAQRHDIDVLAQRFGVGFETVCHRLSTLQRADSPGVPFFFIRVDRAGNISKRQSATHFHFSRTGGTCPLWCVYDAFERPGRIVRQLARMPDGRTYFWIARTVTRGPAGFGLPRQTFAVGLGCDWQHAAQLVYARDLNLQTPEVVVPIGMGCKVCERPACPQRAFPYVGKPLDIDENVSRFAPYGAKASAQPDASGHPSALRAEG
ncbi:short-chain fatty acyl-CoA regulator family protein [Tepidimonas charontis]|uniref:HTH-type transcriptional regulator PrpR n=1 Tax=Tepidimonas charontis TaxID=2267262 RepID=A0A554X760_9BURK|nr:short-chain fatty acyl-CoA regulator family protein [Tepidimonas charontis]TSE31669.1 HTH-type transcriptional regulator PrpR [Tepidimonas charontis]